jgi:hypothetical protein
MRPRNGSARGAPSLIPSPTAPQSLQEESPLPPRRLLPYPAVNASQTPANAERKAFPEAEFLNWLDEDTTPALISEGHGQFYAYCVEFGVAGSGATEDEALADAINLLMSYLVISFSEGQTYRKAKKAPPAKVRFRRWYLLARKKSLGRIRPSLSRLGGLVSVPTTNRNSQPLAH